MSSSSSSSVTHPFGEKYSSILPPPLRDIVAEYTTLCDLLSNEGKDCSVNNFQFNYEGKTIPCYKECRSNLCPGWIYNLVRNLPTSVLFTYKDGKKLLRRLLKLQFGQEMAFKYF